MVRTFETRNPLRMSPERFMALRVDESFDHAMAELEQQILHIPTREETEDGLMHKVSEFEWKESPVPPLFRGLLGSEDAKMTVEETFDPRRVSFASAKQMKTVLPGKLSELLRIETQQWVERISDTEVPSARDARHQPALSAHTVAHACGTCPGESQSTAFRVQTPEA